MDLSDRRARRWPVLGVARTVTDWCRLLRTRPAAQAEGWSALAGSRSSITSCGASHCWRTERLMLAGRSLRLGVQRPSWFGPYREVSFAWCPEAQRALCSLNPRRDVHRLGTFVSDLRHNARFVSWVGWSIRNGRGHEFAPSPSSSMIAAAYRARADVPGPLQAGVRPTSEPLYERCASVRR
jgi:hypothetical protein